MSWQGTNNVDRAAIFNTEGNSVWATSPNFKVSPEEMQAVVAAYKDPGKDGVKNVQASGLHIAKERFVVLKADDRSIYGKKVSPCISFSVMAAGEFKTSKMVGMGMCSGWLEQLEAREDKEGREQDMRCFCLWERIA
ncbi:profilin, required for normal timing of actin polymerization in response to thermal stress [Recurvomyces mirabilis]|nr:profilin, required for normal timing of actin polymerization in response to thermal stress [Recurvomyces mirabilis]